MHIVNRYALVFSVFFITSCEMDNTAVSGRNKNIGKPLIVNSLQKSTPCMSRLSLQEALTSQGFTVGLPVEIKKSEIETVADNVKAIQKLITTKNQFYSFNKLNRFLINKDNSKIRTHFYCFEFQSKKKADTWFRLIDNSKPPTKRLIVFSKPKKLMALAGHNVYLLEGYNIANYDVLRLIINQLGKLNAVLGPRETEWIKENG